MTIFPPEDPRIIYFENLRQNPIQYRWAQVSSSLLGRSRWSRMPFKYLYFYIKYPNYHIFLGTSGKMPSNKDDHKNHDYHQGYKDDQEYSPPKSDSQYGGPS